MADQSSKDIFSDSGVSGECSDTVVQLNIKTLDSQIYSFQVNKNMPVCLFKEKIATEIGVPVGQQRLIFRGRVLKDDDPLSEYHVDNGHTLHLVVRQQAQSHASTDGSATITTESNSSQGGNSTHAGAPQSRVGQISHSVVLGTLNIGDAGENAVPDLSRVIGAVLSSIGIGSQSIPNGVSGFQSSIPAQHREGLTNASVTSQSEAGNQGGQPLRPSPQAMQIPLGAANVFPIPSLQEPIPDSLSTLLDFMNCMERALSQTGYELDTSSADTSNRPRFELPSNSRGFATPEALSTVLQNAVRLLGSHATAALSHLAGRLEQESTYSDANTRGQFQNESAQIGLAMQHLGALLLEIGRTILTLRIGQSQAESSVNAGPAVYISPSGPNPIMVQPFPLQTSSLFGGAAPSPNPAPLAPGGIGSAPRHINIHIHAGSPLSSAMSAVGGTSNNGDGVQGELRNINNSSSGSGSVRVLPIRNVIAAAVPSRATGIAVSSASQTGVSVPTSQSSNSLSVDPLVSEINARIRDMLNNMQSESQVSGQSNNAGSSELPDSTTGNGADDLTEPSSRAADQSGTVKTEPNSDQKDTVDNVHDISVSKDSAASSLGLPSFSADEEVSWKPDNELACASNSSEKHDSLCDVRSTPLGLGTGGLERKKRSKQKSLVKGDEGRTSAPESNQDERGKDQQHQLQLLQSLFPSNSSSDGVTTDGLGNRQQPSNVMQSGESEELNVANAMSQVLESPALDRLLAGVSGQAGASSPGVLRNMLQQFTQNPQIMSTVQQIAQQVDAQELENMFSGEQGGGLDLSRMVQQMMPVVSRAFSQSAAMSRPSSTVESLPVLEAGKRDEEAFERNVRQIAERIEGSDSGVEIFRALVENSVEHRDEDLVNELCSREDLANEYREILKREINRRLQRDPGRDH